MRSTDLGWNPILRNGVGAIASAVRVNGIMASRAVSTMRLVVLHRVSAMISGVNASYTCLGRLNEMVGVDVLETTLGWFKLVGDVDAYLRESHGVDVEGERCRGGVRLDQPLYTVIAGCMEGLKINGTV